MPRPYLLPSLLVLTLSLLAACEPTPYPRPHGYPRFRLPDTSYVQWSPPGCPFSTELPAYAQPQLRNADSCYWDIRFPQQQATWHLTTRIVKNFDQRSYAYEDHRKVVYMHAQKGEIYEEPLLGPAGYGTFFHLSGESPTLAQFFVGDSTRHALMGSLYYLDPTVADSMAPFTARMKQDLRHMIASLRWED